jgi:hypothetical protein
MADSQFGGGPLPPTDPAQPAPSLLSMLGQGEDPYAGKTLAQIVLGGLPYNMNADANGRPMGDGGGGFDMGAGGGFDANAWLDRPATNENVSDAIQRGGQYRPEVARTLTSSGEEGGFFSLPGMQAETQIPWGYYDDPRKESPAPGLIGMSTNNWRLLPKSFQDPRWAMRAGHIIERSMAQNPAAYVGSRGEGVVPQIKQLGAGGHGFPLSFGYPFGPRASFFPGQLEPAIPEGGPGAMGTGIT